MKTKKWLQKKSHSVLAVALVVTLLMSLTVALAMSGTFAAPGDTRSAGFTNPTVSDPKWEQLTAGQNNTPANSLNANLANRYIISDAGVVKLTSTLGSNIGTLEGLKGGQFHLAVGTKLGDVFLYPYQVTDPNRISAYQINKDAGLITTAGGSCQINMITTPANLQDTITWRPLDNLVGVTQAAAGSPATVTAKPNVTKGAALVAGVFTDQWGRTQTIVYPVKIDVTGAGDSIAYARNDLAGSYQNPTVSDLKWEQLVVGQNNTPANSLNANLANRYIVSDAGVVRLTATLGSNIGTLEGLKGGQFHLAIGTKLGDVFLYPYQVTDPGQISGYTLSTGEVYFKNGAGSYQIGGAVNINGSAVNIKDTDKITWESIDTDIAQVSSTGLVTPKTNDGVTALTGTFEDSWGVRQTIYVLVVIGENLNNNLRGQLEDLLEQAKEKDPGDYPADVWENSGIEDAIDQGETVLDNDGPTDDDYIKAIEDLQDALDKLDDYDNDYSNHLRDRLEELLAEAKGKDPNDYPADVWDDSGIEDAIDHGESVLDMDNPGNQDYLDAIKDLEDALAALKDYDNDYSNHLRDRLEELLEEAKGKDPGDYPSDVWDDSGIEDAIDHGENVLDMDNPGNQDYLDAIKDLEDALDALKDYDDHIGGLRGELERVILDGREILDYPPRVMGQDHSKYGDGEDNIYTPDSLDELQKAVDEAEDLLSRLPSANGDELQAAIDKIRDAIDNLKYKANKNDLKNKLIAANGLVEDDYTVSTWGPFEEALAEANRVYNDPNATAEDVAGALDALKKAMDDLERRGNASLLEQLILDALGKTPQSNYTKPTWDGLQNALDHTGRTVPVDNSDLNQAQADALADELRAALDALVDISGLQASVSDADGRDPADYTDWQQKIVNSGVLQNAKNVLNNANATQPQVDSVKQALDNALNSLTPVGTQEGLANALQGHPRTGSDYTSASWADSGYQAAYDTASALLGNASATPSQIAAAIISLNNATDQLVPRADPTALINARSNAKSGLQSDTRYTSGSMAALNNAIADKNGVTEASPLTTAKPWPDRNAAQQQALIDAINSAKANLVFIGDLLDTITVANLLNQSQYTPGSWSPFAAALTAANTMAANGSATQAQVDSAKNALVTAMTNLVLNPTVTSVTVSPSSPQVQKGKTQQFTATVSGTGNPPSTVTWTVEGKNSANTTISAGGLLTVGENETATTLTVRATSTYDTGKSGTTTVTVKGLQSQIDIDNKNEGGLVTIDGKTWIVYKKVGDYAMLVIRGNDYGRGVYNNNQSAYSYGDTVQQAKMDEFYADPGIVELKKIAVVPDLNYRCNYGVYEHAVPFKQCSGAESMYTTTPAGSTTQGIFFALSHDDVGYNIYNCQGTKDAFWTRSHSEYEPKSNACYVVTSLYGATPGIQRTVTNEQFVYAPAVWVRYK